jgi:hypothetical protein
VNSNVALRLARSGIRSLPDLELVLRALVTTNVPRAARKENLDALTRTVAAVAVKHSDSGAAMPELLNDFENLPLRCRRVVRWVQDVLQGNAPLADVSDLAAAIEDARAKRTRETPRAALAPRMAKEPAIDADTILRETGSRVAFDRLVKAHLTGRDVTPFVGAGLSAESGLPGWRQFLVENAKRFHTEAEVETCLARGDYEDAAQALRNAAEAAQYRSLIETTFGAEREPRGAVCLLPRITRGPVITLNYDRLIEQVYARAKMVLTPVIGGLADTFRAALHQEPSPHLLKVHGDVMEGTHRVLAAEEYARAYGTETGVLPDLLRAACIARRLLFLGCSFADKRLIEVLANTRNSSPGHFAIMAAGVNDRMRRLLSSIGIEVIYYRHRQYGDVQVLLEAFIRATHPQVPVTKRVRDALDELGRTIPRKVADIRILAKKAARSGSGARMVRDEAARADDSIGVLVRAARRDLSYCRELAEKDGLPESLLTRIDAANETMLTLKEDTRDEETLRGALRAAKDLRGAIDTVLHGA